LIRVGFSFIKKEVRALAACDIESPPAISLPTTLLSPSSEKSTESDRDIPNTAQTIGAKFLGVKAFPEKYVGGAYLDN
jgi:hypothetical protein